MRDKQLARQTADCVIFNVIAHVREDLLAGRIPRILTNTVEAWGCEPVIIQLVLDHERGWDGDASKLTWQLLESNPDYAEQGP